VAALREEDGEFLVMPGYPRLNLWPDAGKILYGGGVPLPRLTPLDGINSWWDKRYLDLNGQHQFHETPVPLAAVYVLGERAADSDSPRIVPVSARDAFMMLSGDTYANYALDESMRAREFHTLGQLVRRIPIRLVIPPDRPERLPELCESILNDYKGLA
jgi:hypothetical protein